MIPSQIHPVVEELLTSGRVTHRDEGVSALHSNVSRATCELLYELVERAKATQGIEVGMAYGVSTVCFADALQRRAGTAARLIVFDPTQSLSDSWNGAGLWQVDRPARAAWPASRKRTTIPRRPTANSSARSPR